MIMVLPELFPSTGAALEHGVDGLKLAGAAFPVGIRFQSWRGVICEAQCISHKHHNLSGPTKVNTA